MKVTISRIKIWSYWETFKCIPLVMRGTWTQLQTLRLKFENAMLQSHLNNPNIKW